MSEGTDYSHNDHWKHLTSKKYSTLKYHHVFQAHRPMLEVYRMEQVLDRDQAGGEGLKRKVSPKRNFERSPTQERKRVSPKRNFERSPTQERKKERSKPGKQADFSCVSPKRNFERSPTQERKRVSPRQKFERSPTRERSMAFDRSHITSERDTSPRRHSSPRSERRSPSVSYRPTDSERTYSRRDNNVVYGSMEYTGRMEDTSCGIKNCQIERALKEMQESDEERCPDRKHFASEKCRSLIRPPKRGSAWRSPSPKSQRQHPMVRNEQKRRSHSPEYHGAYDYSYETSRPFADKVINAY
ncbi:hypothetical protein TNCV_2225021 [Trichonephila clavipes]|nr:hypothetical protein TNCV_2225021 [Trichonephila clavipes]